MSGGYLYIVGRAKDMIIINGKNHWPQDIEWAVEQLPGFKSGDIAAFAITTPGGEETPAVLVQCRTSDDADYIVRDGEVIIVDEFTGRTLAGRRSEEHTSELQSLMRISYAVFCLKKKKKQKNIHNTTNTKR